MELPNARIAVFAFPAAASAMARLTIMVSLAHRMYPPPTSVSQITPAWHEAPKCTDVTILFSFIESWDIIKQWDTEESIAVTSEALKQHNDLVGCSCD